MNQFEVNASSKPTGLSIGGITKAKPVAISTRPQPTPQGISQTKSK